MFGLSALTFLNPLALVALLILPVIYWLLRFTPPKPQSVRFPPFALLLDLISKEEETDKTPWWLVLLRLTLAAALIIAIAQPVLTNPKQASLNNDPLLLIVDNDWSTANNWPLHKAVLLQTIEAAKTRNVPVAIALTAAKTKVQNIKLLTAKSAQTFAETIEPQSLHANRSDLVKQLKTAFAKTKSLQIIWLSNGLSGPTGPKNKSFTTELGQLANGNTSLTIAVPSKNTAPIVLGKLARKNGKIEIELHKPKAASIENTAVSLVARNGRNLARTNVSFANGNSSQKVTLDLPLALRNEAARIEIAGQTHAGALRLLDDRWQSKTVGIVTSQSLELAQPLLSPLYYVTRALSPTTLIRQRDADASTAKLLKTGLSMLVLADIGLIAPQDRTAIESWLEKGGVLVRFAGPRLAESTAVLDQTGEDKLIPVSLRRGGRALGSALSWEQPQSLAPFNANSPLAGIAVDDSVLVRRQVLAEPSGSLSSRVWASLKDGTPLITAKREGLGLVVLVHVTANSDWSNLPLSGMFVEILKRISDLAPAITSTTDTANSANTPNSANTSAADAFVPQTSLNGFGQLVPASPSAKPVLLKDFDTASPSRDHPAGLYRRAGALRALNLKITPAMLSPLTSGLTTSGLTGIKTTDYIPAPVKPLMGIFFVLAFILLLADTLATLLLMGGWQKIVPKRSTATSIAIAFLITLAPYPNNAVAQTATEKAAQEQIAMDAVSQTRFAFVRTGNNAVDATSLAGLTGLNLALAQRTSVDPGRPQMIDLEKDLIVFYPLLYWPILENAKTPSDAVVKKLTTFMRNGGTIFFDTRDQNATFANLTGNVSPATIALRRILAKFDIPALEPVPAKHVLTRSFYLLQQFPGRWLNGKLWVESSTTDKSQIDGVSSIIIGANDYASAWAIDDTGRPLYATIPGTPRQREFAYRTGINIVMYTLTGNYKADQVHIPALLERLGE